MNPARNRTSLICAITLTMLAPACLVFVSIGCRTKNSVPVGAPTAVSGQFAGNATCAGCHPKECLQHRESRHDLTLRAASSDSLRGLTPGAGIKGTPYEIVRSDKTLSFRRKDHPEMSGPIDLAFGSGKTGMTYVGQFDSGGFTEYRMSYMPHMRTWYVTPGQEARGDLELGLAHRGSRARRCVSCHAIKLSDNAIRPEPQFFGVGCESCHGPAAAHVAAARIRGTRDLKIERIGSWGAARLDALCARCHRSQDDVELTSLEASMTQRFQPYGLEMSQCFKQSHDKLSCMTCHDPHTNVSTDSRAYERICLNCHASGGVVAKLATYAVAGKPCPVNPHEKCIGCHMPHRQVMAGTKIPTSMADHFIWASRPKK